MPAGRTPSRPHRLRDGKRAESGCSVTRPECGRLSCSRSSLALSWHAVRQIHPREFSSALHALDPFWIGVAAVITLVNIGAMGLYDVIAFSHTRSRWTERWRYGAVASPGATS